MPHRLIGLLATASIVGAALLSAGVAPIAATETSCGALPIDLELVIDRSGSMNATEGAKTRIGWAQEASVGLVNGLDANGGVGAAGLHRVGLSTFGGATSSTPASLGSASNAGTVNAAINAIVAGGGTPFRLGMSAGAGDMGGGMRGFVDGVPVTHVIVFLSDGNPDPDSFTPNATEIGNYAAAADTAYAVAIGPDGGNLGSGGTGVSYALMGQIAKPAGAFRAVTSGSGLPNLFAEILQEINCPQINIEKWADPTSLPAGGGSVTYSYAVTNTVQGAPLSNVTVADDQCAPVTYVGGDVAPADSKLQSGETWTYSCTTTLTETTTNVATAQGSYGGQTFTDTAEATVTVAERTQPTPTPTPTPKPSKTPEPDDDDASLNVRKVDEEGHRLEGAVFTVEGMDGTFTTGSRGNFCITGLPADSEWLVTEIEAPEGYEIADEASQLVEVDDDGDCNSPDAVFVNTLADEDPTETPKPISTPREDEAGGTPTPRPSGGDLPDTAISQPTTNLSAILALVFLSAIGSLVWMRLAGRKVR